MNRADFKKLFAYSDNCWNLMDETLKPEPDVWNASFETISKWNTVRLLLAHCLGAEERLVVLRLQNRPIPVFYEDRAAPDLEGLLRDHRAIRAGTYAYLESLNDAEIESDKAVATPDRGPLTRAEVLFQVISHENYHRGQVIMTLQRHGIDPPNFDYILLKPSDPA